MDGGFTSVHLKKEEFCQHQNTEFPELGYSKRVIPANFLASYIKAVIVWASEWSRARKWPCLLINDNHWHHFFSEALERVKGSKNSLERKLISLLIILRSLALAILPVTHWWHHLYQFSDISVVVHQTTTFWMLLKQIWALQLCPWPTNRNLSHEAVTIVPQQYLHLMWKLTGSKFWSFCCNLLCTSQNIFMTPWGPDL